MKMKSQKDTRTTTKKDPKDREQVSRPTQLAKKSQVVMTDADDVTPIVEFLENFRQLTDPRAQKKSKLISIKIPEPLLEAFKFKAERENIPYQTMIKKLMLEWIK